MVSLLECIRIIFSHTLTERDIENFEKCKETFMSEMISIFGSKIKPKLHNFNHYSYVIREMGPLRKMWMMRYESKHKFFTDTAKKTNNFINITKSLAQAHQTYKATKINTYSDAIEPSKNSHHLCEDSDFVLYSAYFSNESEGFDVQSAVVLNFLKINPNMYRKGLMIINETKISEIIYVLRCNLEYFLVCHSYNVIRFESSLNSFEIKKAETGSLHMLNIKQLTIDGTFEKKIARHSIYVIAENLEVFNELGEIH